jgi:Tol biopolymer transport system component
MKNLFFIILCYSIICCQQNSETNIKAELVGPEIISSQFPEFATTVNADQSLIFFNRTTEDRSSMQILYAQLEGNQFSKPKNLAFSTGQYRDVDPFLTADGKRLYFSSTRPTNSLSNQAGAYNTWYVEKQGNQWSAPIKAAYPLNTDSTEIFISMTKSGDAYFVSERETRSIMVSKFENGSYQTAQKVTLKLHGEPIYASNPCISSDGSFLIVAARDPKGNGTPDLFISRNENGEWSALQNLGAMVNSPYAEFAPGLSKDDKVLYFSSERPGIMPAQAAGVRPPGDIYKINLQSVLEKL